MSSPPETAPPDAASRRAVYGSAGRDDSTAISRSRHEPERFGVIFDRHFAEIHRYVARRLGPDAADDVAAETFLTAFRQRDRYDPARGDARAWLYGIATNLTGRHRRDELRRYRALGRIGPGRAADSHEDRVAARVSAEGVQGRLAGALAGLSPGDRDVLLLVALAGLSYHEVAAALGIAYGTVCSRLNRARRQVRQALGGTDPIDDPTTPHRSSHDSPHDPPHDPPHDDRDTNHG